MANVAPRDDEDLDIISIEDAEKQSITGRPGPVDTDGDGRPTKEPVVPPSPTKSTESKFAMARMLSNMGSSARHVADKVIANDMQQSGIQTFQNGILHPYSMLRIRWDIVIGIIICVQAITIPLRVGFQLYSVPLSVYILDRFVDFLFLSDIVINFNTGYVTINGLVECDRVKVRIHYFFTWFWLDLISSLPYELMFLR